MWESGAGGKGAGNPPTSQTHGSLFRVISLGGPGRSKSPLTCPDPEIAPQSIFPEWFSLQAAPEYHIKHRETEAESGEGAACRVRGGPEGTPPASLERGLLVL